MLNWILLLLGMGLLIKSADWLVDGSSSLAAKFRVPSLVIGLTIVAFGTSFPELVVNGLASYSGSTGIVLGNVIGSNIANILLILGVASMIYPLKVQSSTVWKEIPFSLLAVVAVLVLCADVALNSQTQNLVTFADGLVLLLFFGIFLYYIGTMALVKSNSEERIEIYGWGKMIGLMAAGLVGLFLGGKWVVDSATAIAVELGLSERVVGLTVVAIGTSLPELVTSCIAAWKKQTDIAIGNVVGSNIFNMFWILAVSSLINPIEVVGSVFMDLQVLVAVSVVMFGVLFVGRKFHLTKWEGGVFVSSYVGYMGYLVMSG